MMKAAIYRKFDGPIRVETVPIPNASEDGVVVQVMATGVCRSDWHGWKGHDSDVIDHGLPFCPGHELSGIVVQVGSRVGSFKKGDRVAVPFILSCGSCHYCCQEKRPTICTQQQQPGFTQWGSFAEYVALPRADRNLRHLPKAVSFVQAAALGCRFTTAYRAVLQQGRLKNLSNASVAVFGAGGLGLSCIMLAKTTGTARMIVAIDISRQALNKALQLGATHTIQATTGEESNTMVRQQVLDLTKGHGVDLSIDAAGFRSTCENAVHCCKRGGRMIQVGLPIGHAPPVIPMGLVAGRELELVGSHGFAADDLPALLEMVATGALDPSLLVEKEVTLQEGVESIQDMDHGSPLGITVVTQFQHQESRL